MVIHRANQFIYSEYYFAVINYCVMEIDKNRELYVIGLIFITLIVLLFQPDAGQLTAFAFATAMIVWKKISNKTIKLLSLTLMAILVSLTWYFIDDLAPVPYVEHIIFLVRDMGKYLARFRCSISHIVASPIHAQENTYFFIIRSLLPTYDDCNASWTFPNADHGVWTITDYRVFTCNYLGY